MRAERGRRDPFRLRKLHSYASSLRFERAPRLRHLAHARHAELGMQREGDKVKHKKFTKELRRRRRRSRSLPTPRRALARAWR